MATVEAQEVLNKGHFKEITSRRIDEKGALAGSKNETRAQRVKSDEAESHVSRDIFQGGKIGDRSSPAGCSCQ